VEWLVERNGEAALWRLIGKQGTAFFAPLGVSLRVGAAVPHRRPERAQGSFTPRRLRLERSSPGLDRNGADGLPDGAGMPVSTSADA
jgi:hypothetical protein